MEGFSTQDFSLLAQKSAELCVEFQIDNNFESIVIPARFYSDMVTDYIEKQKAFSVEPFLSEISKKNIGKKKNQFFKNGWNLFDFVIVAISLVPNAQSFSVLRALRIFRILRVVSAAPRLRRVVEGFVTALPGMASVFLLMGIIFYIGAVIATKLFGAAFPEWFGSLARSAYSLFQIMTLESWSMGIVRPVMEKFPYAWAFFIPFIMVTTFAVVNLLVGLIVNSMQDAHQDEENQRTDAYRDEVMQRLQAIEAYLERSQSKKDS